MRARTGSRGIEPSRDCPGRDRKGHGKHGTVQDDHEIEQESLDGIGISRGCTGLDFAGRKKHGILRDPKGTVLHGTGFETPRDFTGGWILRDAKKHGTRWAAVLRPTLIPLRPSPARHRWQLPMTSCPSSLCICRAQQSLKFVWWKNEFRVVIRVFAKIRF